MSYVNGDYYEGQWLNDTEEGAGTKFSKGV